MKLVNGELRRVNAILAWVMNLLIVHHLMVYGKHLRFIVSLDINDFLVSGKDGHRVLHVAGLNKAMREVVYKGGAVMLLTQNDSYSTERYLRRNGVDTSLISLRGLLCGAILEVYVGNTKYTFNLAPEKDLREITAGMNGVHTALQKFVRRHGLRLNNDHHPFDVPDWSGTTSDVMVGVEPRPHDISIDARVFGSAGVYNPGQTEYLIRCLEYVARRELDARGVILKEDSSVGGRYMVLHSNAARKVTFMRLFRAICNRFGIRVIHGGDAAEDIAVTEAGVFLAAPAGTPAARSGKADLIVGPPGLAAHEFLNFAARQDWGLRRTIPKTLR